MSNTSLVMIFDTTTDLKAAPIYAGAHALLVSKTTIGDNLGGFYRWIGDSTAVEDAYMNAIISNNSPTGRWVRIFQKVKAYPHGIMVNAGGVKTFYATSTIDASGSCTLNLTDDNTTTGNALFTEVWWNESRSNAGASSPTTAVNSYIKSLSTDLKQTTHGYFKANPVTITLGMAYAPFAAAANGGSVQFTVIGI